MGVLANERGSSAECLPVIRVSNPGLCQSDDDVMRQFVGRERELDVVLKAILDRTTRGTYRHTMVVAPRGAGKTMFLVRLGIAMREDSQLSDRVIGVRLGEDCCHSIHDDFSLWSVSALAIASAIEAIRPDIAGRLTESHAVYSARWKDPAAAESMLAAISQACLDLDRLVVLMVDNMQDAFKGSTKGFGKSIVTALNKPFRRLMLVGTTANMPDEARPLTAACDMVALPPLGEAECGRLLSNLTGKSEVEHAAIATLAGGSARFVATVGQVMQRHPNWGMEHVIIGALDSRTWDYLHRINGMPKTERRVCLALARLVQPAPARDISAEARFDIRIVTALFGRLVKKGMVAYHGCDGDSARYYYVVDPQIVLYYLIRSRRHDEGLKLMHSLLAGAKWPMEPKAA